MARPSETPVITVRPKPDSSITDFWFCLFCFFTFLFTFFFFLIFVLSAHVKNIRTGSKMAQILHSCSQPDLYLK